MRAAALLVGALALLELGGAAPAAQRQASKEADVPFRIGETLTYDVTWSSYLVAGTAVTTVREKSPSLGSTAYTIVAEGRPVPLVARLYTLYYRMESVLDAVSLLPQRSTLYAEEGKKRRTGITRFDRPGRRATFEEQDAASAPASNFAIPSGTLDGLSAVYALRTRTLRAGDRVSFPVADDGNLYDVQIAVGEPERVSVPFGATSAWKLSVDIVDAKGQPAANNAVVWMANDARRLPVKLQAGLPVGDFVLLLREAR